jgi:hypothetical protein
MIPLNINFLKSQPTIADLNKVVKEAQSPIKSQLVISGGERLVEQDFNVPNVNCRTPRTLNYTKLNEARRDLEWQKIQKDLQIPTL